MRKNESRRFAPGGGNGIGGGVPLSCPHGSTNAPVCKAPLGSIPPRLGDGGLILIGSQHVARIVSQELQRTLDLGCETLNGSILFRCDVLALARQAGARVVVCKDRASGDVYCARLDVIERKGWIYRHRKYGLQVGLNLALWERKAPEGEPVQMSLFEGAG